MFCSQCGKEIDAGSKFCSNCGANLSTKDANTPAIESAPTWKATGKLSVIKHPIVKGKEPLEGEWKYDKGVIQRKALFKSQIIDLKSEVSSAELALEPISMLAGLKKSQEITPELFTIGAASPLLMMAYTDRKLKILQEQVLMDVALKDGSSFLAFTSAEILAEIMSNITPEGL